MSTAATASTARPAPLAWMTYAQWVLPVVIVAAMGTLGGFIRYGHTHSLRSPQLIGILVIAVGTLIASTCIATYIVWVLGKVRAHEEAHALLLANQWRYLVNPDATPLRLDDIAVQGDPTTTIGKAFRDNDTVPDSVEALKQAMTTGHLRAITPLMVPGSPVAMAAIAEEKLNAASEEARAQAIAAAEAAVREAAAPVAAPMEGLDLDKNKGDGTAEPAVIDEDCPVHGHGHHGHDDAEHAAAPAQGVGAGESSASECLVGTPNTGSVATVAEASPCARTTPTVTALVEAPAAPLETPAPTTPAAPVADAPSTPGRPDPHSTLDLGMYKDPRKTGAIVTPAGKRPGDMFSGSIPVVRRRLDGSELTPEVQRAADSADEAARRWREDVQERREVTAAQAVVSRDDDVITDPVPVVEAPAAATSAETPAVVDVEPADGGHDDVPADLIEDPEPVVVIDEAAIELGKVRRHAYRQFMINSAPARAVLVAVSTLLIVCAFIIGGQALVRVPWSTEAMALKMALWIGCGVGCLGLMYMIGPGLAGALKGVDSAYPEFTAPRIDKGARITLIVLGLLAVLVGYAGMYAMSM